MAVTSASLRTLHRILRQLSDLRSRLERGPKQIKARQGNLQRLQEELAVAKENVTRGRVSADQKELQLKEREQRIEDVRRKLNAASSNREYQAFLEQIAADEQANSVLSDEILELLDKIGELQKTAEVKEEELQQCEAELEQLRSRVDAERQLLEVDVARLTGELTEAEKALSEEVRADYQRIVKVRGEDGLAPVDGDCCGGCYQTITPQMVNELLMEKLVYCKSCGCPLYLPEDREPKRRDM